MAQAPYWCCCGGGGGGDDCCVCGRCYFDPDAFQGQVTRTGSSTINTSGTIASKCCSPFGPGTPCANAPLETVYPTLSYPEMVVGISGCNAFTRQLLLRDYFYYGCFGEQIDITDAGFPLDGSTLTASGNLCPQFVVPSAPGALFRYFRLSEDVFLSGATIWGGTRCLGPISVARFGRPLIVENMDSDLGYATIYAVAGAGGGSAFIADVALPCVLGLCLNGCYIGPNNSLGCSPVKINGGGSVSGGFDCGAGVLSVSGSLDFSFLSACEVEFVGLCGDPDGCHSDSRCVQTGTNSVNASFGATVSYSGLTKPCQPLGGRSTYDGPPQSEDEATRKAYCPPEWRQRFPGLAAAVDYINLSFEPRTNQVPPPASGVLDPAVLDHLNRDPMRRCRGCGQ